MLYADDACEVVWADTPLECHARSQEVADNISEWYKCSGLSLNPKKSEYIPFNYDHGAISVDGTQVEPKKAFKFLGCHIQADLNWNTQVKETVNKMRKSAARIRIEGRNAGIRERKVLYYAWVHSHIMCNAGAYLPLLGSNQMHDLQTAANAGIRAICRLPKHGQVPMTSIREKLQIPSVETVRNRVMWVEAWKRKPPAIFQSGPTTRGQSAGNVLTPDLRGWNGKRIQTLAQATWNELPTDVRNESDRKKATALIKKICL